MMDQECGLVFQLPYPPRQSRRGERRLTRYPLVLDSAPAYRCQLRSIAASDETHVEEAPEHQRENERIRQHPSDLGPTITSIPLGTLIRLYRSDQGLILCFLTLLPRNLGAFFTDDPVNPTPDESQ